MKLPDGQLDLMERERESSGAPTVGKTYCLGDPSLNLLLKIRLSL